MTLPCTLSFYDQNNPTKNSGMIQIPEECPAERISGEESDGCRGRAQRWMPGARPGQSSAHSQDPRTTCSASRSCWAWRRLPQLGLVIQKITFDDETGDRVGFVGLDLWELGAEGAEEGSFSWMGKKCYDFMDNVLSHQPLALLQARLAKPCLFLQIIS